MKSSKMICRRLCAVLMAVLLLAGTLPPAFAEETQTFTIRTAEDWEQLAGNCRLDVWSQGVEVVLEEDLELKDATPIPSFSGTFDGRGHTLSGVTILGEGDHQGLFRYIRKGALVKDLKVTGVVIPSGDASCVGGIAGVNAGTLTRCSFSGVVSGTATVGGLVGSNEPDGQIVNCINREGSISGEHYTGGIAGENYGVMVRCVNHAQINTQAVEMTPQLEGLDWEKLNSTENLPACTDTGGIAGYSGGVLQSCTNTATVGYPHLGYNVGGVVGRQTGTMNGCINSGLVQGRKEVGGIVGQAEPYTSLRYEEDTLQKLTDELESLSGSLTGVLSSADASRHDLSTDLSNINSLAGQAHDSASSLLGDVQELGGAAVDTINELSVRISRALDQIRPVTQDLQWASGQLAGALGSLEDLVTVDPNRSQASRVVGESLKRAREALQRQDSAMKQMNGAMNDLLNALGDDAASAQALDRVYETFEEFSYGLTDMTDAVYQAANALESLPGWGDGGQVTQSLDSLKAALDEMGSASLELSLAIQQLRNAQDAEGSKSALDNMGQAMQKLTQGGKAFGSALTELKDAAPLLGMIRGDLEGIMDDLDWGLASMIGAANSLNQAFDNLGSVLHSHSQQPPLLFPKLPGSFHEKENQLGNTLGQLGQQMESVNQNVNHAGDAVSQGIREITAKFDSIVDLLQTAHRDAGQDKELVVDVSDEDIASAVLGKIQDCKNIGAVEGDVNIGGVVGSMAIEFDFDPEDDVTDQGGSSLRFQYLTRAIVQGCSNRGEVRARKNGVGGIVGRMDLGVTLECENLGPVITTDGEMAGGIAGVSYGVIRDCWAKSSISGKRRVGGVAGWAEDIRSCRTLVEIRDAAAYAGAIAGECEGNLQDNIFVSEELGGVDGISYQGKAQPVPYAQLAAMEQLPEAFSQLTVEFTADGQLVKSMTVDYGAAIADGDIPAVPQKPCCSGAWEEFDREKILFDTVVDAVYTPWRTTVASGDGQILAEGIFGPEAQLSSTAGPDTVPPSAVGKFALAWTVSLTDSREPFTALRVKLPEDCKKADFWVCRHNGEWEKLPSTIEGTYLRAELVGTDEQICIMETISSGMLWIAGGAAAVLLGGILMVHRHRKKKTAASQKT